MKWLRNPVNQLWCLVAFWLLLCIRPVGVEILGGARIVVPQAAVLVAHESKSGKTGYTEHSWSDDTYRFKLKAGGEASITLSEDVKLPSISDEDNVDLGFALGEIATIDGQFVAPLGFFELLAFGMSCSLLALAVLLTLARRPEAEREKPSVASTLGYGLAAVVGAVPAGIPALFAGMILGLVGFTWWPLPVAGAYILLGYLIGRKKRKKILSRSSD